MKINHWLWLLWGAMILSMLLKGKPDTLMIVALIVLPILIVLLDMHEEVNHLKEEAKHQRKFVMERYQFLLDKVNDLATNVEKKLVVDFSEFAKDNVPRQEAGKISVALKKKKKKRPAPVDLTQAPVTPSEPDSETPPKKA